MADEMLTPGRRLVLRDAAIAGLVASGAGLGLVLGAADLLQVPGFIGALADGTTRYVPLPLLRAILAVFGPDAKGLLFLAVACGVGAGGVILGVFLEATGAARSPFWADERLLGGVVALLLLVGGAIGPIFLVGSLVAVVLALLAGAAGRRSVVLATLTWLLCEIVIFPMFGEGIFGEALAVNPTALHGPLAAGCLVYAAFYVGTLETGRSASPRPGTEGAGLRMARRQLLARVLRFVGLGALASSGLSLVLQALANAAANRPPAGSGALGPYGPTPAVTPLRHFYVVSIDLVAPKLDTSSWRLSIGGLVRNPHAYALDELHALPRVEGYRTLECISSVLTVPDDLISNQWWAGVRLGTVLSVAQPAPGAAWVIWTSADGYTESLPLADALDPRTWLAYEMGTRGTPLSVEHGYPLRALIPGRYGMKQPKWLTGVTLADHDIPGYWEQRGWDEQALVRTYSRIDFPRQFATVPAFSPFTVYGVAFAGVRGISKVEISPDAGHTWLVAELEPITPGGPVGALTWRPWRAQLTVQVEGAATLVCRAVDGDGRVQDPAQSPPLPRGATGYCAVPVTALRGAARF